MIAKSCLLFWGGLFAWLPTICQAQYPAYPQSPYLPSVSMTQWQLGVGVRNLPGGCQITRITPGSVATQAGLKVSDVILAVSGTPVGYQGNQLYDLADVFNSRADVYGRVTLTVQDARTGQVANVPVRLAPADHVVNRPGFQPLPPNRPIQPALPGNASQQIQIWYLKYLGRAVDPEGLQHWLYHASIAGINEVLVGILCSSEYYDRCYNNPTIFVQSSFKQFVGRPPNREEMGRWSARLSQLNQLYRGDRSRYVRELLTSYREG